MAELFGILNAQGQGAATAIATVTRTTVYYPVNSFDPSGVWNNETAIEGNATTVAQIIAESSGVLGGTANTKSGRLSGDIISGSKVVQIVELTASFDHSQQFNSNGGSGGSLTNYKQISMNGGSSFETLSDSDPGSHGYRTDDFDVFSLLPQNPMDLADIQLAWDCFVNSGTGVNSNSHVNARKMWLTVTQLVEEFTGVVSMAPTTTMSTHGAVEHIEPVSMSGTATCDTNATQTFFSASSVSSIATTTAQPSVTAIGRTKSYRREVLEDSPLIYLPLDDHLDSDTVMDISGNGNHGTIHGPGNLQRDGATLGGKAIHWGSGSDSVPPDKVGLECPDVIGGITGTSKGTVELWVDTSEWTDGNFAGFYQNKSNLNPENGFLYGFKYGQALRFRIFYGNSGSDYNEVGDALWSNIVAADGWHHFVFTWDFAGATKLEMFIDGESVDSLGSLSGGPLAGPISDQGLFLANGHNRAGGGPQDEYAVYSEVLTPARIKAHYEAAQKGIEGRASMVAHSRTMTDTELAEYFYTNGNTWDTRANALVGDNSYANFEVTGVDSTQDTLYLPFKFSNPDSHVLESATMTVRQMIDTNALNPETIDFRLRIRKSGEAGTGVVIESWAQNSRDDAGSINIDTYDLTSYLSGWTMEEIKTMEVNCYAHANLNNLTPGNARWRVASVEIDLVTSNPAELAVNGSANIQGNASSTIVGDFERIGQASLSGSATMESSPQVESYAESALTGVSATDTIDVVVVSSAGAFFASASYAVLGLAEKFGRSNQLAEASIASDSFVTMFAASEGQGASTITTASRGETQAAASMSGTATQDASATVSRTASAMLSGEATQTTVSTATASTYVIIWGLGSAASDAMVSTEGQSSITANATTVASGAKGVSGQASLAALAISSSDAHVDAIATSAFTTVATLTSNSYATAIGDSSVQGTGLLSILSEGIVDAAVSLSSAATASVVGLAIATGSANASSQGSMTTLAQQTALGLAGISATSVLECAGVIAINGASVISGLAEFSVVYDGQTKGAALLSAYSSLAIAYLHYNSIRFDRGVQVNVRTDRGSSVSLRTDSDTGQHYRGTGGTSSNIIGF